MLTPPHQSYESVFVWHLETQWEIQIEHVYFTMGAIVGQNRYPEMVMGSMTN
jgi:hypothetical protein